MNFLFVHTLMLANGRQIHFTYAKKTKYPSLSSFVTNIFLYSFFSISNMDPFVQSIASQHIWETAEWEALKQAVPKIEELHLKDLLKVGAFGRFRA